jgi:type III secretory pathway component EscV
MASVVSQQMETPFNSAQQTIVSGTTKVVVVVIPGFPIESVIIGCSLGLLVIYAFRKRRTGKSGKHVPA